MWSYYGSKTNQAKHYPPPKYGHIIEPFSGAAKYSLLYWDREITLIDKYEIIIRIWQWLQQCSKNDILKLPRKMAPGSYVEDLEFDCQEARWLYGFVVGKGAERPRNKVPDRTAIHRPNHINQSLIRIANDLHKIKHWNIIHNGYDFSLDIEATWFIDPPYQYGGHVYPVCHVDYNELARWSRARKGQIIVCENTKADWMNFKSMLITHGSSGKTTEAIWSNHQTAFDNQQLTLI